MLIAIVVLLSLILLVGISIHTAIKDLTDYLQFNTPRSNIHRVTNTPR